MPHKVGRICFVVLIFTNYTRTYNSDLCDNMVRWSKLKRKRPNLTDRYFREYSQYFFLATIKVFLFNYIFWVIFTWNFTEFNISNFNFFNGTDRNCLFFHSVPYFPEFTPSTVCTPVKNLMGVWLSINVTLIISDFYAVRSDFHAVQTLDQRFFVFFYSIEWCWFRSFSFLN